MYGIDNVNNLETYNGKYMMRDRKAQQRTTKINAHIKRELIAKSLRVPKGDISYMELSLEQMEKIFSKYKK
jgi:hypothetical protein